MRFLLILPLFFLSSCQLLDRLEPEVIEEAINAGGDFYNGNWAAGAAKSIDIVLILLGLKTAQKGAQLAKAKLKKKSKKKKA